MILFRTTNEARDPSYSLAFLVSFSIEDLDMCYTSSRRRAASSSYFIAQKTEAWGGEAEGQLLEFTECALMRSLCLSFLGESKAVPGSLLLMHC